MDPLSSSSSPPVSEAVPISMAFRAFGSLFFEAADWTLGRLQTGAIHAAAAPTIAYLSWGDDRFLEEITGSKEIFAWIESFSPFLPDWLPEESKKKLALHFIASSARALKYTGKVETGQLLVDLIRYYEVRVQMLFEEVESLTRKEGIFPEERHFAKGTAELMQCAIPESRGILSGFVRRFLYECYVAMNVSLVEPDPLGCKTEMETALFQALDYLLSQKLTLHKVQEGIESFAPSSGTIETKRTLTEYLFAHKALIERLQKPLARLITRKFGEHFKAYGAKTGSEYLFRLAGTLGPHSPSERLIHVFLGDLQAEARIPKGLRRVIFSALIEKVIPRYRHEIDQGKAFLAREGTHGGGAPFQTWKIAPALEEAAGRMAAIYYPKLEKMIPSPWDKIIPLRLGEAFLKELLMHLMRNFAKEIELPPPSAQAFIEMILHFVIEELEKGIKGAKSYPSIKEKTFESALEVILTRLFPAALLPPLEAHKTGGRLLYQLWEIHESFNPESIESAFKSINLGHEEMASSFCLTFDALIADFFHSYRKKLEAPYLLAEGISVSLTPLQPLLVRLEQVTKVLGFEWILSEMNAGGGETVERLMVGKLCQLKSFLPERYEEHQGAAWRPFSEMLFVNLPKRIPYREKLITGGLPAFLASYKEFIRLVVEQEAIDRSIVEYNPYRGDLAIQPAVDQFESLLFGDKDRYPLLFTRPLVERVLQHFMARMTYGMRSEFNARTPFTRLFIEGAAGFEEGRSEGMLARMAALIHPALVSLVQGKGKVVDPYLKMLLSKNKILHKTALFESLSGIREGLTDWERATLIHEFAAHRNTIETLVKGASQWIVKLTVDYHSSEKADAPYLRDIYSREEFSPLKTLFADKIEETFYYALLHIVQTFKRGETPVENKDLIRIVLNEGINLIKAHAPSSSRAKDPASWLPLIRHLLKFAFGDPLRVIPTPEEVRASALAKVEEALSELAVKWHERIYRYIHAAEESRGHLKKSLGPNTVALFATVLGRRWIPEFIPYIIQNEVQAILEGIAEWTHDEMKVDLPPEAFLTFKQTLLDFAKEYPLVFDDGRHSAIYELSHWIGEYAEGYILKFLSGFVSRLKDLESDRPLLLIFLEQVIPKVSEYYDLVQTLKKRHNVDRVESLPRSVWVQALEPRGLRSPALPSGIRGEAPLDAVRRAHFEILGARLVNSLGLDYSEAPFPPPLEEDFQRILVRLVLANTLLAIETSILENRGEFLLEGYSAIKQASKQLTGQVEKEKEAAPTVDPHLKKKLGDILVSLVAKLPNHPWAPVMEIRQLKQATGEQLVDLIASENIFIRLNQIFETLIPKLVPGEVVSVRSGDFEFKPDPTEKISFTTRPKNRSELIRQIRKVGAEAFISGLESLAKERLRREKRQIEAYTSEGFEIISRFLRGAQDPGAPKSRFDEILEDLFDWVKYICEKGYTFLIDVVLIPLLIGILYIPYHLLIRWPLTFYFSYLAKNIYDEVTASYHEGVLLNLIDAFVDAIAEDRRGAEEI